MGDAGFSKTTEPFMLPEWIEIRNEVEATKANLSGADLSSLKLMKARLDHANLSGADLSFSYLMRADLREADLSDADLTSAVLAEANLKGANLEGAELTDAYLHGADLSETRNLTCDQLESAFLDRETKLPVYITLTWLSDSTFECCD